MAGIQLQEESVNLWKELLSKLGSPEEFQAKLESMRADAFPETRKRMEQFVETFNRMSNRSIDLVAKTLAVYQATSVPEAQRRVHRLSTLWTKRALVPASTQWLSRRMWKRSRNRSARLTPRLLIPSACGSPRRPSPAL
jgi:ribosomal 50S subunit-associated protein YjgA (DUF615 family)